MGWSSRILGDTLVTQEVVTIRVARPKIKLYYLFFFWNEYTLRCVLSRLIVV